MYRSIIEQFSGNFHKDEVNEFISAVQEIAAEVGDSIGELTIENAEAYCHEDDVAYPLLACMVEVD